MHLPKIGFKSDNSTNFSCVNLIYKLQTVLKDTDALLVSSRLNRSTVLFNNHIKNGNTILCKQLLILNNAPIQLERKSKDFLFLENAKAFVLVSQGPLGASVMNILNLITREVSIDSEKCILVINIYRSLPDRNCQTLCHSFDDTSYF